MMTLRSALLLWAAALLLACGQTSWTMLLPNGSPGNFGRSGRGSSGQFTLNRLTHPAAPVKTVTLWGVGLRPRTASDFLVDVAGESIPPSFAEHAPGFPGRDQINVTLR